MGLALLAAIIFGSRKGNDPMADHNHKGITNQAVLDHGFLVGMYSDDFSPKSLVSECENELLMLCRQIESISP